MKIEHVPHSNQEVTDTDKLSDIEAMILEKSEELRKLCFDTSRQAVIIVDAKGMVNGGGYQFWNMKIPIKEFSEIKDGEQIKSDSEEKKRAFDNILQMMNQFCMSLTGGQVGVVPVRTINEMAKTIAHYNQEITRLKERLSSHGLGDEE